MEFLIPILLLAVLAAVSRQPERCGARLIRLEWRLRRARRRGAPRAEPAPRPAPAEAAPAPRARAQPPAPARPQPAAFDWQPEPEPAVEDDAPRPVRDPRRPVRAAGGRAAADLARRHRSGARGGVPDPLFDRHRADDAGGADGRAPACSAWSCSAPANMRARGRLADDPRIAQALVGAGIAVLYATFYGSYLLYGLIDSQVASAAMLAVTAAALGSVAPPRRADRGDGAGRRLPDAAAGRQSGGRRGAAARLSGACSTSPCSLLAWRRGWTWLAAAAAVLSFVWTGFLIAQPGRADALLAGGFVVAARSGGLAGPAGRGAAARPDPAARHRPRPARLAGRAHRSRRAGLGPVRRA